MKTSESDKDASLELLLDTICNTFGGIIFIALLLVILLNTTTESTTQIEQQQETVSAADLLEADNERANLTAELERLQKAVDAQAASAKALVSKELIAKAERLEAIKSKRTRLVKDKSKLVGQTSQAQADIDRTETANQQRDEELRRLRVQAARLKNQYAQAANKRAKTAKIPRLSFDPGLRQVNYMLRYGRLYGPTFTLGSPNTRDFAFNKVGGKTYVDPRPESGLRVYPNGSNLADVANKLSPATPGRDLVVVDIWQDSFDEYDAIKTILEQRGIKIGPRPQRKGARLPLGRPPRVKGQ